MQRTALLSPLLLVLPLLALQDASSDGAEEQAPRQELELPATPEDALGMLEGLGNELEDRSGDELKALLGAWLDATEAQASELEAARAAPAGSPENRRADHLQTDHDVLVGAAESIHFAMNAAGGADAELSARLDAFIQKDVATYAFMTAPSTLDAAISLDVEVLKAELRPLRREDVAVQLEAWLALLQRSCLAVRNIEVASLRAEDPDAAADDSALAVRWRGFRARLITRVEAVIDALERKGGDVEEARDYVDSVVVAPPVTGARAAWATTLSWLKDENGGIATGIRMLKALGVLIGFWIVARLLAGVARKAMRSMHSASELLRDFVTKTVRRATLIVGVLIALSTLGVNMTPLLAAIGAAGLVIGLALQGTLGNLASGMMILVYRPFDVGDIVITGGASGKVVGMTLMTTAVRTPDNQTTYVPNNAIWGDVITNVTANETRRVDMVFGIGYDDDAEVAREVLLEIVKGHPKVLADPEPVVRVHELADSSVNFVVRPWANTSDYWEVFWDVTAAVKRTFDERGISIPFPQRDVHLIPVGDAPAPSSITDAPAESDARRTEDAGDDDDEAS